MAESTSRANTPPFRIPNISKIKVKFSDIHTQRTRRTCNIKQRLVVSPEPDLVGPSLEPNYLAIVRGRPNRKIFNLSNYVSDVRGTLLARLQTGVLEQEILRSEERFRLETQQMETFSKQLKLYQDSFERFLAEDHDEAQSALSRWKEVSEKARKIEEERSSLQLKLSAASRRVFELLMQWKTCLRYKHFLMRVSGSIPQSVSQEDEISEDELIKMAIEEEQKERMQTIEGLKPPERFCEVLSDLELQNLNALQQSTKLSKPLELMREEVSRTRISLEKDEANLQDKVAEVRAEIAWQEERAKKLETEARKVLLRRLKKVSVADKALRLYVSVEDVYESCITTNDSQLGLTEMMREIEARYAELLLELDSLPRDIVKRVEEEGYRSEAERMRKAKEATKKVVQLQKSERRLKSALQPRPNTRSCRQPASRSAPLKKISRSATRDSHRISSADREHEYFFSE